MTLIKNKEFKTIFNPTKMINVESIDSYDNKNYPYIGMGNPDANILLVGNEKALDSASPIYHTILMHELLLNYAHWHDIITHYNHLEDTHGPILLNRVHPLMGFNPFNPLLFPTTRNIVIGHAGHTYYGLQRLINSYEANHHMALTNIEVVEAYYDCSFAKCFITEINANPALKSGRSNFNLRDFFISPRYVFMTGKARDFYSSFRTVVIYAGKNNQYVGALGTIDRLKIINIFNPNLVHTDMVNMGDFIYYHNGTGARVILCRHLSTGFSNALAGYIAHSII